MEVTEVVMQSEREKQIGINGEATKHRYVKEQELPKKDVEAQ